MKFRERPAESRFHTREVLGSAETEPEVELINQSEIKQAIHCANKEGVTLARALGFSYALEVLVDPLEDRNLREDEHKLLTHPPEQTGSLDQVVSRIIRYRNMKWLADPKKEYCTQFTQPALLRIRESIARRKLHAPYIENIESYLELGLFDQTVISVLDTTQTLKLVKQKINELGSPSYGADGAVLNTLFLFRLLMPKQFQALSITNEQRQLLRGVLNMSEGRGETYFSRIALELATLQASEVTFTKEDGLRLRLATPLAMTKPLPNRSTV